jgi:hypothetical protein
MSFILDALRKSENERQRDATASLSRAPLATVRHRTPAWIWVLIAMLSLSLLVLAAIWWRGNQDTFIGTTEVEPRTSVTDPPATENQPAAAETQRRPALSVSTPESLIPSPIRPVGELAVVAPNLPRLRLELLAYNGRDPAGGSAWINGRRYFVGERVANGPELVEVRPDGVVLAFAGERYLLTTR